MNRSERRYRTEKIAKKRFRQLYCHYHGTPEAWFYRVYDKNEQSRKIGQCRDRRYGWRCRCEYCLGRVYLKQSISDQNFRDQLEESVTPFPLPYVMDVGSSIYDLGHERWDIYVRPWPHSWNMGDRFHHPKVKLKHNGH